MDRPAAWHPDPAGVHDHRWWDGQRWTEHVADAGVASVDPLPDAPPATGATDATDATDATGAGATDATAGSAAAPTGGSADAPSDDRPVWERADAGDAPAWGEQPSQAQPPGQPQQPRPGQQPWGTQQPGGPQGGAPPWGDAPSSTPVWGQQPSWESGTASSGSNGLAVGSLIAGILSLPLLIAAGLGALLGIVALVLGIIAVRRANRGEAGGKGMAIGGIVTGAISIVLGIFIGIFIFTFGLGVVEEMEACLDETGGDQQECQERLEREITDRFLGD